jgi:hypothetical protein
VFDDLAGLFHENVVAAVSEYLDIAATAQAGRSRDLRAALSAAEALFNFREHMPAAHKQTRSEIEAECPDYGLVADVANAKKHRTLTQGRPRIASAEQIEERILITEYRDEQGDYRHAEKQVVIKLEDGHERDLRHIVLTVLDYWRDKLSSLGLVEVLPSRLLPIDQQPRPRSQCNNGILDVELICGVRFKQVICIRRFNYASGQIEPVDLTGRQFQCGVYEPPVMVSLTVTSESTGKTVSKTLAITAEQARQLLAHDSESDRKQYLTSLPQAQNIFTELAADAE